MPLYTHGNPQGAHTFFRPSWESGSGTMTPWIDSKWDAITDLGVWHGLTGNGMRHWAGGRQGTRDGRMSTVGRPNGRRFCWTCRCCCSRPGSPSKSRRCCRAVTQPRWGTGPGWSGRLQQGCYRWNSQSSTGISGIVRGGYRSSLAVAAPQPITAQQSGGCPVGP